MALRRGRGSDAPGRRRRPRSAAAPARTASRRCSSVARSVLRLPERQERQRALAGATAGDVHLQLGQPEQPGHERLADVDALQPVDPDPARLPGDHAGVDAQLVGLDPVLRAQPRGVP